MVEQIRGLVRPIITFLLMLALIVILCRLVWVFASVEMAKVVLNAFLILVASLGGYWFGSRQPGSG